MLQGPLDNPLIIKRLNYHARLKRLLLYMREHLSEPLQLDDAARVACMERTAFSRFFVRAVGINFHDFVQQWRIVVAVEQMSVSDSSLTDVAFATGFQTMQTFERTFKKFTGITPSAYRKGLLQSKEITPGQEVVCKSQKLAIKSQETTSSSAID